MHRVLGIAPSPWAKPCRYRGPDSGGFWHDQTEGLHLVFRRLAIQDPTLDGNQPMVSASGRFVAVFNGEIYNFKSLRVELEQSGVRFRGHSDTEVMLEACEQWGFAAALQKFNGMFACALWDKQEKTLCLVRDRMGRKAALRRLGGRQFGIRVRTKSFSCNRWFFKDG